MSLLQCGLDKNLFKIESIFNEKVRSMTLRLQKELDYAFKCFNLESMCYNDVKFSKIAYHIMFLVSLGKYANVDNQIMIQELSDRLNSSKKHLDCFIQVFINE
jgi:hypothetical protein